MLGADGKQELDSLLSSRQRAPTSVSWPPFKKKLRELSAKVGAIKAAQAESAAQQPNKRRRKNAAPVKFAKPILTSCATATAFEGTLL